MYSVMNIFFIFWIAPSQPGKRKTAGMKWKEWNWFLTLLHTHRGNFEQYKEVRQHDDELCICRYIGVVATCSSSFVPFGGRENFKIGYYSNNRIFLPLYAIVHTAHLCNRKEKKRKKDFFRFFLANKRGNSCKNGPISRPELFLHQLNMQPLQNVVLGEYLFWCF